MIDFRFVFLADCQLGCYATFSGLTATQLENCERQGMRVEAVPRVTGWDWDAGRLRQAVERVLELQPAFVVVGGDMIDDPGAPGQYEALRAITAGLDPLPVHWVPGNHDCADDCVVPTPETLATYRGRFGPDHYAFEHHGVVSVVLNTVVLAHPEQVPGELDRQMAFLEQTLRGARSRGARHILAFGHHPLFTERVDEPETYWNIPPERRRRVLDLFRTYGVRAFFCGHWHRNGGGWDGDVEVVVTGPVGYPLGVDPSGLRIVDVADAVVHRYVALDAAATPVGR